MSRYRARNWSPLEPEPEYPKPQGAPIIDGSKSDELDGEEYLTWYYKQPDADTISGYWVRIYKSDAPTTVLVEKYVAEPDTDVIVSGLVNGVLYLAKVSAQNRGGEGPQSAGYGFMPMKPQVPAPTLKTLTAGDGQGLATWSWAGMLPDGFTYDWVSYEAVNEVGSTVTEHVVGGDWPAESGKLPLTNDHDWKVALVAVATNTATNRQYVSDLSNSITIHPEAPLAPYKPRLTGAQIAPGNNGQIDVAFAPGIQNVTATRPRRWWHKLGVKGRTGPADINQWQVRLVAASDAQVRTYDILDGSVRTYTTEKEPLGTYTVDVKAHNGVGWSPWSNSLQVTYKPTDTRPFTADKAVSYFTSDSYQYAIFDPGNDPGKGWDATWTCTLTAAGQQLAYDVLVVGAGGGGKGVTATFGKGGNGGGGQMYGGQIPALSCTTFTVFISIGGSTGIDPKDTTVKAGNITLTGKAGKSASSGTDATGYDRMYVTEWTDCTTAFGWLTPDSQYVGGVAQEGKQGYPNGLGWGCAGAGTKGSNAGKGVEGLVVIRWPK